MAAVADRLLLSTRQVRAIEAFDLTAFHNTRFYAAALKKYAALCAVDAALVERATEPDDPVRTDAAPAVVEPPPEPVSAAPVSMTTSTTSGEDRPRAGVWMGGLVAAGLVGLLGVLAFWWWPVSTPTAAPMPVPAAAVAAASPPAADSAAMSQDVAPPPLAPEAASPAPAAAPVASQTPIAQVGRSGSYGGVRPLKPTWVFVRYAGGQVVERPLGEGETFTFEAAPIYLVVGSPEIELTLADRSVDVTPFIVNGQVRMRAADLAFDTGR